MSVPAGAIRAGSRPSTSRTRRLAAALFVATTVAAVAASVGLGALAGTRPLFAAVVIAALILVAIAILLPLTSFALLLLITAIVPFHVQNRFGLGGGTDDPGLLVIDVLLLLGLARVAVSSLRRRWDLPFTFGALLLLVVTAQFMHGLLNGWELADAGTETRRAMMAAGAFVLALHMLESERVRRRLPLVLLVTGFAVGVWGLAQWFLGIEYPGAAIGQDLGVREDVPFTTAGRGMLQGGLYVFPVAVILAFAALVSGSIPRGWRLAVWTVLAMNSLSLLFTYERTFWVAAVVGCAFVLLRERPRQRRRALVAAPSVLLAAVLVLAVTAPGDLIAAFERLLSIAEFRTDDSVQYRRDESAAVLAAVQEKPILGHGFGAGVTWRAVSSGLGETTTFAHNGYLWLSWKLGVVAALVIVAAMAASMLRRDGAAGPSMASVLRRGAQGTLLALLIVNITFPSFNNLGIGVTTGLLLALCWRPSSSRA